MSTRYLLDTNILIYIRQNRFADVTARFLSVARHEVAISVITYGELLSGVGGSRERVNARHVLDELCSLVPPLPLPANAARLYGDICVGVHKRGEITRWNDLWIAAHALAPGVTLVTSNVRKFQRVPKLKLENWVPNESAFTPTEPINVTSRRSIRFLPLKMLSCQSVLRLAHSARKVEGKKQAVLF